MDNTLQRIIVLMKNQGIQDQQMITYLGLARGTFANWRRDVGKSYYEYIDRIADRLGVTIDYLVRGEDLKSDSLDHQETELVESYRKLNESGKKIALDAIQLMAGMK